jgi:hypothetical protein
MLNHSVQKGQGKVQSKIFALLRGAFDGACFWGWTPICKRPTYHVAVKREKFAH